MGKVQVQYLETRARRSRRHRRTTEREAGVLPRLATLGKPGGGGCVFRARIPPYPDYPKLGAKKQREREGFRAARRQLEERAMGYGATSQTNLALTT